MKINKELIKALEPCEDGYEWYLANYSEDLLETLLKLNRHNASYSRWLFSKLMNKSQCIEIAIYSAEQAIDIFEKRHPDDKRPRKAIEAVKVYLENPNAAYAAYAAYAAAYAAYAYIAYTDAANADAANADAANADAANAKLDIQESIIRKAVEILDRK